MAKPAFIRYLPARLKPLGNPAIWAPLTVIALLGAILWEYRRNPDWFNRQPITDLNPESSLTAEEEARLSEIDNLDLLLNGARVPEDTKAVTSQINPDAPTDLASEDLEDSAEEVSSADAIAKSSLEDYPIPGSPSVTAPAGLNGAGSSGSSAFSTVTGLPGRSSAANSQTSSSLNSNAGSLGSGNTNFNFGNGLVNPAAPSTNSALAEAVNRREAQLAAEQAEAEDSNPANAAPSLAGSTGAVSSPSGNSTINPRATSVVPSLSVPGSFMRTTPDMSPPVGTTGYQVPGTSSLPGYNVAPARPTRSPFDATSAGSAGSQSVVPAPASVAPPAIGSPSNLSNGTTNNGRLYTAPSSVQPEQDPVISPRL